MNKDNIEKIVYTSIADVCNITAESINANLRIREDLNITSIDALTLLATIEDRLDIELDDASFIVLIHVGDIINQLCQIKNEKA